MQRFELERERNLFTVQAALLDGSYRPGLHPTIRIDFSMPKLIAAAPFRDRVVQHPLCSVSQPLFERNVPIPDARMLLSKLLRAGQTSKIPPDGGAFRLDEKDPGTERVYVVVWVNEVGSLGEAERTSGSGQGSSLLAAVASAGTACKTRGLSFVDETGCVRKRGWGAMGAAAESVSYRARTEAGGSIVVQGFRSSMWRQHREVVVGSRLVGGGERVRPGGRAGWVQL